MERFWNKVNKIPNGCWEWTARIEPKGYGRFSFEKKPRLAHRMAWFLTYGYFPIASIQVCHKCDNRKCVNPAHLFLGTNSANQRDRCLKGRASKKLSSEDVLEIRASDKSQRELAKTYKVDQALVQRIKANKIWKHVK